MRNTSLLLLAAALTVAPGWSALAAGSAPAPTKETSPGDPSLATPDPALETNGSTVEVSVDRFTVRFENVPSNLELGDRYANGRIVLVDRTLEMVAIETDDPAGLVSSLVGQAGVAWVQRDPVVRFAATTPDDPRFADQYGPQQVRAPEAWDTTLGTTDATLCILDTGLRDTHEEFPEERLLGGVDLHNGDPDPLDDLGHGTHVTGIAAAGTDNARGIAGVAQAGVYSVKVLDSTGTGYLSSVASGIRWCADNAGERTVISMSLTASRSTTALSDAIEHARSRGALIVAAAGNQGPCTNCVRYPAAHPGVVAVTCTTEARERCSFSSQGSAAEIAAPGASVLSSFNTADDAYRTLSGTSMSTPHVAGAAALAWSQAPELTADELRELLASTARDLGPPGPDDDFGAGLLDAHALLEAADGPDEDPPEPGTLLEAGFDDGLPAGWEKSGLWHASQACVEAASPPGHLAFRDDADCTYDTGEAVEGAASVPVDLTGASQAHLVFEHRWETESYVSGSYDRMAVQLSTDAGRTWTSLAAWDSRDDDRPDWHTETIDLDDRTGETARLRFHFDTVDTIANRFEGWAIDDVRVVADAEAAPEPNRQPTADAGPDPTVRDADGTGAEPVALDGSASTDPDGPIEAYAWTRAGTQIATGPTPQVDLPVGTHAITLAVTDGDGAVDTDTVEAAVLPNRQPVADAGPDRILRDADGTGAEPATLDGTGSSDPDGPIERYAWQRGGSQIATGPTADVDLPVGTHEITLEVEDAGSARDTDTAQVHVLPNRPPTARIEQTVDGLAASLDGTGSSDPEGALVSHVWWFGDGSGPTSSPAVTHTFDEAGTYTVELVVEDEGGATDTATEEVTVTGPIDAEPVYAVDMDGGLPDWSLDGSDGSLWRIGGGCLGATSGQRSLQFNLQHNCGYQLGIPSRGQAASPQIDLSDASRAELVFQHAWETESYDGAFDVMRVQVSADGGASWTTVRSWDARDANRPAFHEVRLDVSEHATDRFHVRFAFDSVDAVANGLQGWAIDDLRVLAR